MRQRMPDFEDAFAAGLLHDIGIVLEDQYAHAQFRKVIQDLDDGTTLVAAERKRFGFDHCQLGKRVAESWHLSERVLAAIGHHHDSSAYRGQEIAVVRCIEVADAICTLKGYSPAGRTPVSEFQPALAAMSLTRAHLSVLSQDLDEELAKNADLFDL